MYKKDLPVKLGLIQLNLIQGNFVDLLPFKMGKFFKITCTHHAKMDLNKKLTTGRKNLQTS